MSKAGKKRTHDKKMKAKRAAKAARRAAYAALAGTSRKSKKLRARGRQGFNSGKHQHLIDHCGNAGCSKCYPKFAAA